MQIERTPLKDVLLIKPKVHGDNRGFFFESFQQKRYAALGLTMPFVQDNCSRSGYGTLRGLHFQKECPQGKLVMVTRGSVFDVAVDIRVTSPTFGKWYGAELTEDNHFQLWVPPGFAHGFCVLSDVADFTYKCTEYYKPDDEGSILWKDPFLNIVWPLDAPVLSQKDQEAPLWKNVFSR